MMVHKRYYLRNLATEPRHNWQSELLLSNNSKAEESDPILHHSYYIPSEPVEFFRSIPRFGHKSNVINLLSSNRMDSLDYFYGMTSTSLAILLSMIVWLLLLFSFKMMDTHGAKKKERNNDDDEEVTVSTSFDDDTKEDTIHTSKNRKRVFSYMIKVLFIMVSVFMMTTCTLFISNGSVHVKNTTDSFHKSFSDVNKLVSKASDIVQQLIDIGTDAKVIRDEGTFHLEQTILADYYYSTNTKSTTNTSNNNVYLSNQLSDKYHYGTARSSSPSSNYYQKYSGVVSQDILQVTIDSMDVLYEYFQKNSLLKTIDQTLLKTSRKLLSIQDGDTFRRIYYSQDIFMTIMFFIIGLLFIMLSFVCVLPSKNNSNKYHHNRQLNRVQLCCLSVMTHIFLSLIVLTIISFTVLSIFSLSFGILNADLCTGHEERQEDVSLYTMHNYQYMKVQSPKGTIQEVMNVYGLKDEYHDIYQIIDYVVMPDCTNYYHQQEKEEQNSYYTTSLLNQQQQQQQEQHNSIISYLDEYYEQIEYALLVIDELLEKVKRLDVMGHQVHLQNYSYSSQNVSSMSNQTVDGTSNETLTNVVSRINQTQTSYSFINETTRENNTHNSSSSSSSTSMRDTSLFIFLQNVKSILLRINNVLISVSDVLNIDKRCDGIIHQVYEETIQSGLCEELPLANSWIFITCIGIALSGILLLTLRSLKHNMYY